MRVKVAKGPRKITLRMSDGLYMDLQFDKKGECDIPDHTVDEVIARCPGVSKIKVEKKKETSQETE